MNHVVLYFFLLTFVGSSPSVTGLPHVYSNDRRAANVPQPATSTADHFGSPRSFSLPLKRTASKRAQSLERRGIYSGNTGLGDFLDLFYTVPITLGNTTTAVNIDTGSSDLWVVSDACSTDICSKTNEPPYPTSRLSPAGGSVNLLYGDSVTGTHASGPIGLDTGTIAGLAMKQQAFAAVSDTNNTSVMNGANGIFGLGFPSGSQVQAAVINNKFNSPSTTDDFILNTATDGPLLARLTMSGYLEQPMFSIMLQRNLIDLSGGNGEVSVGKLPDGIDNSSLTWLPVRLYTSREGGLNAPTFAPKEVYPLRWEVELDGVYLDGQKLNDPASSTNGSKVSALIDTGNSILRGPSDVVTSILKTVSPAFAANPNADPTYPCLTPHNLSFQFGGKMFPIDPRDFVSQDKSGDAKTCIANNVVATDAPSYGALFSWSLGDPFFKSNLVVFYYGNMTHPSVDPPRIGFLSMVPTNADAELSDAVNQAVANGGNFESTSQAAPTAYASTVAVAPTSLVTHVPIATGSTSDSSAVSGQRGGASIAL
ncbi:acid protease [Amylostereum chailletii]|nr:acid protease [Amylostereum chailletii]